MIILASKSERRIELLRDAGIDFKVVSSNIDETVDDSLRPEENAMNIALLKAKDVFSNNGEDLIIAADTIVTLNNKIYGKPGTEEKAIEMLRELSGKKHNVITGVAILRKGFQETFFSQAKVEIKKLTEEDIIEYVKTKEPLDKAGAYAIQGIGKQIVETYEGDFFTIVGLPLKDVLSKIKILMKE